MERMAADFIPTVMSRGFHAGPVFGIFGAAIAAAKIMRLNEDQMNSTIALCASLAQRQSRRRAQRRQGAARRRRGAQRACSRSRWRSSGHVGGETVLEGEAGFYHAYAGNNRGRLTYSFVGDAKASLDKITAGSRQGLDVPRDAVSHLLDRRLQHRAHRRDRGAVQREQHPLRGHRPRRGGGELDGDAVSEPRLSEPPRRRRRAKPGGTAYYTAYGVVAARLSR